MKRLAMLLLCLMVCVPCLGGLFGLSSHGSLKLSSDGSINMTRNYGVVPGMVVWYDASDESTIVEAGGVVSQWNDKSGNGHNAVPNTVNPPTGSAPPTTGVTTLNGLNVITFNERRFLMPLDVIPTGSTHYTVFVIWSRTTNYQTVLSLGNTVYKEGITLARDVFGLGMLSHSWISYDLNYTASNPSLMKNIISFDGTTRTTIVNSDAPITDTPTGKNTGTDYAVLGGLGTSNNSVLRSGAYIAEIAIYHRALTATEIAQVETYLNDKWGI